MFTFLIKRSLAGALAIAAVGFPASAQAKFVDDGGALSAPVGAISQPATHAVASSSDGLQWGDVGIGAAGATLLLGAGGLMAGGRSRRRHAALS